MQFASAREIVEYCEGGHGAAETLFRMGAYGPGFIRISGPLWAHITGKDVPDEWVNVDPYFVFAQPPKFEQLAFNGLHALRTAQTGRARFTSADGKEIIVQLEEYAPHERSARHPRRFEFILSER